MPSSTFIDDFKQTLEDTIGDNALALISDDAGVMIVWDATWAFVKPLPFLVMLELQASDASDLLAFVARHQAGDIAVEIKSLQEQIYSLDTLPAETMDWQGICERLREYLFPDD